MAHANATKSSANSEDDAIIGMGISLLAAVLYALGLCIQRAALAGAEAGVEPPWGCREKGCVERPKLIWLLGLAIYGACPFASPERGEWRC